MKKMIVRAPVRADLAGGTLDLWPLYLFHPGSRTVHVAVSFYAESEVTEISDGIEIQLTDQQHHQTYQSLQELSADPKAALIFRVLEHFKVTGVKIVTRTDAPRGSGLGGSSALAVTLVRALSELAGEPLEGETLIALVRDLETRLLGLPAGIQDYYPPVFGGLASLHLLPGAPVRYPLSNAFGDLASHFLLHYTGIGRFSGTNNWMLYKRQVEKKKKVQKGLQSIAETSVEMERALESSNYEAAGRALAKEWANRKALIDGITTPEVDAAIEAATNAGAWGGKVCGAGGGGCVVFLLPPEKREDVVRALATVAGRVLDAFPVAHGMTIDRSDSVQTTLSFARARLQPRATSESIEQLYVYGGRGDYHPYVLAEGAVTHTEGRSGIHHTVMRSYVAPIEPADGKVLWHRASLIDAEHLDIRAVPNPEQRLDIAISPEALVRTASQSEDGFKQFLEENERLQVYHNATFGLWSEPNETRASFLERCREEATKQLDDEAERLESTFRRRIDQLRERSEREQRDRDDEGAQTDHTQDVNVNWGQTLYNITSGRPAAVAETSVSAREVDYLENIAQIQRAWDKELQSLREELEVKAREIEDVSIIPTPKNIEVTKYLILWAAGLP
ncbi:MAG TPA: hypothetical protein VMU84_22025 [Thermoanaerobaculia bacterium]|nr:hypothetical protein [Thermoanaerobaculia bacterium]